MKTIKLWAIVGKSWIYDVATANIHMIEELLKFMDHHKCILSYKNHEFMRKFYFESNRIRCAANVANCDLLNCCCFY